MPGVEIVDKNKDVRNLDHRTYDLKHLTQMLNDAIFDGQCHH